MQDYHSFLSEARAAFLHIGERRTPAQVDSAISPEQARKRRARNVMTDEVIEYRALAGQTGRGPVMVEISHGRFLESRLIGITAFHVLPESREWDHEASDCFHSIHHAAAHLRLLNGDDED